MAFQLLSTGNPKTAKGLSQGYITYILHLAPVDLAGRGNVCPKATVGCSAACLNTAGRGGMFKPDGTNSIQAARKRKTQWWFDDREGFLAALRSDIERAVKQAEQWDLTPTFRLNGTSDIQWERYGIIQQFPHLQFYDYTKIPVRGRLPNYHLTFSRADHNHRETLRAQAEGMSIAVVFDQLPTHYMGLPVFDGDQTDLRFLDPKGHIIGLKAKGRARKDQSGFVVYADTIKKIADVA
jgi:hypothetical protein